MSQDSNSLPGAFAVFTCDDPAIVQARHLIAEGKLAEAKASARQPGVDDCTLREMAELIARIRAEYRQDAAALLERIRTSIPNVTAQDLARWTRDGQVQCRILDGRLAYFHREPSNLFRFCPEAIARRLSVPPAPSRWPLESHLADVIAQARQTGRRQVAPVRHRVRYTLTIPPNAPGLGRGSLVRVWLPFPQEYRQQTDVTLISAAPGAAQVAPALSGEGSMEGSPQRTAYFEEIVDRVDEPLVFEEVFAFTSAAWYPRLDDAQARPLAADWRGGSLDERPPHIVFTAELRKTVAQIVGDEANPLAAARRIFYWIDAHITYHAEEEYCIIPSLSQKALATRRGDCGVQAMLFIAMCRCSGIPARWQSGWQTKPFNSNMHDWCEIYIDPWGWLPVDPSHGLQKSDDPAIRDFYFGHQDSYRLIVNRDYGHPLMPPKSSLRSEPLDFQRGEVEIDGRNLYFPYWSYKIEIEHLQQK